MCIVYNIYIYIYIYIILNTKIIFYVTLKITRRRRKKMMKELYFKNFIKSSSGSSIYNIFLIIYFEESNL